MEKSYNDFWATIQNLETCLKASRTNKEMYRVIATQLGILLCDQNPLIPRLFPNAKFHPLIVQPQFNMENKKKVGKDTYELEFNFFVPALFGNRSIIGLGTIFYENKKRLKFKTWINQPLFSKDFTLRDLIKLVRNKEGSHSDPVVPIKLKTAKKFFLNDEDLIKRCITCIGEYILIQSKILGARLPSSD